MSSTVPSGYPSQRPTLSRRRLVGVVTGLASLGMLAACSPAQPAPTQPAPPPSAKPTSPPPATTPQPTAAPAAAQPTMAPQQAPATTQPVTWKHAIVTPKADAGFQVMADEKGYFREHGLDVEYVIIEADTTHRKALLAGEVDSTGSSGAGIYQAISQGAEAKSVGADFLRVPHVLMVKKDINTLEDLYGKTLSISAPNDIFSVQYSSLFEKYGLDINRTEMTVVGGSAAAFQALIAGKVDAISTSIEFSRQIQPTDNAKVLLSMGEELPDLIRMAISTRNETIATKRETLVNFMAAYIKGFRYAAEHKDEAVALSVRLSNLSEDDVAWTYDKYLELGLVNVEMAIPEQAIEFTQQQNVKIGTQERVLPVAQVHDASIVADALKLIGQG